MNNDTVVKTPGWIRKLIGILQEGRAIGMISPLFETKKRPEYKGPFVETDYCRGHCFVVKREVVDKIGFLDEAFGFGYYDDVDYSLSAAKAGYHCVMANDVIVEHVRNSTFTSLLDQQRIFELQERNRRYLETKWGRRLRLVFIVDGNVDVPRIARLLFAVARQRHYIYIWNTGKPIELAHTNMVEKIFPGMLSKAIFQIMLALNRLKKPNKHYNKVFDLRWRFDEDDIEAEIKSMARV
jgi:GT2 family glycosyltransferase